MAYLWVKALHIIAVIAWMAGLLYLPRLFVYHAGARAGSELSETFKVMERRLLRAIMTPAMLVSWALGLFMLARWTPVDWSRDVWLWSKLGLVVALTGYHMYLARCVRLFAEDANERSAGHYRVINEIPTLVMIAIVIMVVVKPL